MMKAETKTFIFICLVLWATSIYFGWLKEVYIFGINVANSFINDRKEYIASDISTIETKQHTYKLLTEINIPNNITAIEQAAFKGNLLTSITIGSNVSLGKNAFGYNFEAIYNGNNKHAGTYTRANSKSKEWIIWKGNFAYISQNNGVTITGYNGLPGDITIPAEVNGEPVTTIAEKAFLRKGLTGVTIPNSVHKIEVDAFSFNPIIKIVIPENVTLGENDAKHGILGTGTGFNTAYSRNYSRGGVYTRRNADNNAWSRTDR